MHYGESQAGAGFDQAEVGEVTAQMQLQSPFANLPAAFQLPSGAGNPVQIQFG